MNSFPEFFCAATGFEPYPYQRRVAEQAPDFLKVETGLGKTEALVLGWDWRRRHDATTPRRLIYVLPMRSLVQQTVDRLTLCGNRLREAGLDDFPLVESVMGGDVGEQWFREPEKPAIVVGTQDMLLSRALNRGYAMSRFQWPMTFGAISNDVYWVIDEVQLQGIGAVTAAQLQAFRDRLGCFGSSSTTFASATLDSAWLETAEYSISGRTTQKIEAEDREVGSVKAILDAPKIVERLPVESDKALAEEILIRHRHGTLTLVIMNTVRSAKEIYRQIQKSTVDAECTLLHSQFRPLDREKHAKALIAPIDINGAGRIVIATQVVEAGVDVSAATLFTEAAPWSSLVQRFGRCNRRGTDSDARIMWIDRGEPDKKNSRPYEVEEIQRARAMLTALTSKSAAPSCLPDLPIERGPGLVLRRPELLDLFDTSSDLSGHDVDVAPFIRGGDEFNVFVLWRDEPPSSKAPPRRSELCPAPIGSMREVVKKLRASGNGHNIRIANQFGSAKGDGRNPSKEWSPLLLEALRPGLQVWMHSDVGCYDSERGFEIIENRVEPIGPIEHEALSQPECDTIDGDFGSEIGVGVTITQHARDTLEEAKSLLKAIDLGAEHEVVIKRAALWHDVGKGHNVFQKTMRANMPGCPDGLWAKSPRGKGYHERKGFRHELPSALAYIEAHATDTNVDVIAFLIAAHHGKLRVSAPSLPYEAADQTTRILGNEDGDRIPAVDLANGEQSPAITVSLEPFRVASTNGALTWVERTTAIRDQLENGPFRLAFLELLVRLADWRASAKESRHP